MEIEGVKSVSTATAESVILYRLKRHRRRREQIPPLYPDFFMYQKL